MEVPPISSMSMMMDSGHAMMENRHSSFIPSGLPKTDTLIQLKAQLNSPTVSNTILHHPHTLQLIQDNWTNGLAPLQKKLILTLVMRIPREVLEAFRKAFHAIVDAAVRDDDEWVRSLGRLLERFSKTARLNSAAVDSELVYKINKDVEEIFTTIESDKQDNMDDEYCGSEKDMVYARNELDEHLKLVAKDGSTFFDRKKVRVNQLSNHWKPADLSLLEQMWHPIVVASNTRDVFAVSQNKGQRSPRGEPPLNHFLFGSSSGKPGTNPTDGSRAEVVYGGSPSDVKLPSESKIQIPEPVRKGSDGDTNVAANAGGNVDSSGKQKQEIDREEMQRRLEKMDAGGVRRTTGQAGVRASFYMDPKKPADAGIKAESKKADETNATKTNDTTEMQVDSADINTSTKSEEKEPKEPVVNPLLAKLRDKIAKGETIEKVEIQPQESMISGGPAPVPGPWIRDIKTSASAGNVGATRQNATGSASNVGVNSKTASNTGVNQNPSPEKSSEVSKGNPTFKKSNLKSSALVPKREGGPPVKKEVEIEEKPHSWPYYRNNFLRTDCNFPDDLDENAKYGEYLQFVRTNADMVKQNLAEVEAKIGGGHAEIVVGQQKILEFPEDKQLKRDLEDVERAHLRLLENKAAERLADKKATEDANARKTEKVFADFLESKEKENEEDAKKKKKDKMRDREEKDRIRGLIENRDKRELDEDLAALRFQNATKIGKFNQSTDAFSARAARAALRKEQRMQDDLKEDLLDAVRGARPGAESSIAADGSAGGPAGPAGVASKGAPADPDSEEDEAAEAERARKLRRKIGMFDSESE